LPGSDLGENILELIRLRNWATIFHFRAIDIAIDAQLELKKNKKKIKM